ncbi:isopenicillin N synthase family dioxygenase [Paraherbaspirillum soli]|uniref:2-oxoglutarate-dependent ethylene/succinate-forming enzyme n=1 Tax=Paraherbaspirillum soli TaxID=631222 RepID=A0ABW0MBP1_9BURK
MPHQAASSPSIPTIDIAPLFGGNQRDVDHIAESIADACKTVGFFTVVNHGIAPALIDSMFQESKNFFARPLTEKMSISNDKSPHMRGYFPVGAETPEYEAKGDLKEGFDMCSDLPPDDPDVLAGATLHGPNVWPPGLPGFKRTMTEYHAQMLHLSRRLLAVFARGLGKPDDFFDDKLTKPLAQLRLLHYPPQHGPVSREQMGCGEHTDYGTIALLSQDIEGLEILAKDGSWITVQQNPAAFIVNIGDLMARWTNDRYVANLHRVINASGRDRYSAAFFLDPDYHAKIECIDTCVSADAPGKYAPIIFGEYAEAKLDATFQFRQAEPAAAVSA